jgi:hypothetical protein
MVPDAGFTSRRPRGEGEERHAAAWARFADPQSTPLGGEPVAAVRVRRWLEARLVANP